MGGITVGVEMKETFTPPGSITAEGVLKAALTELWEKARKAKLTTVTVLSVRLFDATDAFRMLHVTLRNSRLRAHCVRRQSAHP